jgi:hypothetical protein
MIVAAGRAMDMEISGKHLNAERISFLGRGLSWKGYQPA